MEEQLVNLKSEVNKNTETNAELRESIKNMKQDIAKSEHTLKEEMATTRLSISNEMGAMREEQKNSENKTNEKLDNNNSKLDEVIGMFSLLTNNKIDNNSNANIAKEEDKNNNKKISGKKRVIPNRSLNMADDTPSNTDNRLIFNPENKTISNLINNLSWVANRLNTSGISEMEIHDSQYVEDHLFENCDTINYQDMREGTIYKLKNN
jgi:septal ring factor EnvC (AmiA/AmiB activator)